MYKLLEHFKRMQEMASRYLEPAPYVNRNGASGESGRGRDDLFTNDMLYMLDGREQREAQEQAEHAWGDLRQQSNHFTQAAIMIRSLMRDLGISDHLVSLPGGIVSSAKLLAALDECDLIPTMDAYMRVCRASHWHSAQLRANGIEPMQIPTDAPQYAPEDFDFGAARGSTTRCALLRKNDRSDYKLVPVPDGQTEDFDDGDATRKWLWPHLGRDWHLAMFVDAPVLTS